MPTLLAAADLLEEGASVVIVGGNSAALAEAALSAPDPAVVVLRAADGGSLPVSHPAYGKAPPTHGAVGLCVPAERVRLADDRCRGPIASVAHASLTVGYAFGVIHRR